MYKYLFGPVPSRRLGMSLGIDLVPKKVCSLNCVYCEVGESTKLTLARDEYIPFEKLKEELDHFFSQHPDPDFLTFSGYGEPTLHSRIGDVLRYIKEIKAHIPTAVLTNGTLLHEPSVRAALKISDVVLPSIDAASQEVFDRINRPQRNLKVAEHIDGLVQFRKEYTGKIWLEVFILPGYNDHPQELQGIKKAIENIQPDAIQLNTLDRPGTISGLRGANQAEMEQVKAFLNMEEVQIINTAADQSQTTAFRNDIENAISETISRRPCTLEDLCKILGLHANEINKYLRILENDQKIEVIQEKRGSFYQLKEKNNS